MQSRYLDGTVFLEALRETAEQLRVNREEMNRINVFPVPDGDTGNNLYHTLESALQEAEHAGDNRLGSVVNAASRGAQNGSCGSSGAIFAQFLVGWSLILCKIDRAGVEALVKAMKEGTRKAYAAVLKPVEGTILTVARMAAEGAQRAAPGGDIAYTLREGYRQAVKALNRTPGMLEALGRRGVIDAGGWGLLLFFSSLLKAMQIHPEGEELNHFPFVASSVFKDETFDGMEKYDLEFIVNHGGTVTENQLRSQLYQAGSELITRPEPECCHIHIHADNPQDVVERAASLAPLKKLAIRNMSSQFRKMWKEQDGFGKNRAVIAVGKSPGFLALFALAGADAAVSEDLPRKISQLACELKPENPVIVAAGKSNSYPCDVPAIYLEEEARVLSALLIMNAGTKVTVESINMSSGLLRMTRLYCSAGNYYFRDNGSVKPVKGRFRDVLSAAAASLDPQKGELLSLYYGRGIKRNLVERGAAVIQKRFPYLDVDVQFGGQEDSLILVVE